ncbi:Ribonuclease 2 [Sarracenia purpurea var. burkii]
MASLPTQTLLSLQFLGLLIASIFVGDISDGFVAARTQREFDYFALALQWPGTFCQKTRHCCSSNACCRGSNAPTEFTIHGLWPDYNDGTWPACCTRSSFDIKKIATLHDALEKYWPSLSCGSSSTCHGGKGLFWAHEWEKHGTCSFPAIRDEYEYFSTTLNLYFKYNVTKVLNDAGYVPSNSDNYPLGGVISAIQNAFQATPLLVCSNGAVEELRLCFYKDFKPRDCVIGSIVPDGMLSSKSSCPKYVSLPAFTSLGLENGGEEFPWLPQIEAL